MHRPPSGLLTACRLLLVAVLSGLLLAGCESSRPLTRDEVDGRAQEYFLRGMEAYQRGDVRTALESFRLARVYDVNGANPQIADMLDKAESKLKVGGARQTPGPAVVAQAPTPTARPVLSGRFRTHHSRLYPFVLDVPDTWTNQPGGLKVGNTPADVLLAPAGDGPPPMLSVVAHLLPPDIDRRGYAEAHYRLLRSQGIEAEEIGRRTVDGNEAMLLRARVTTEAGKRVDTLAVFASEQVGWALTFSALPIESEQLQPLFQHILDTFKMTAEQSI